MRTPILTVKPEDEEPHWAEDWSTIVCPEGWAYVRDTDHDGGSCAIYRHKSGRTVHVELPD